MSDDRDLPGHDPEVPQRALDPGTQPPAADARMYDETPTADLGGDDARTAELLRSAFAGVVLDRPSPAAAGDDAETAALLEAAFAGVVLDRPAPSVEGVRADEAHGSEEAGPDAALVVLPGGAARPRARRWSRPAVAAAAAVALATTALLWPSGSGTAWAAEPRVPEPADRSGIEQACAAPLARGLGELEGTGSASVDGSAVPEAPQPGAAPPTSLPALAALDVRGDLAYAVFQDASWTVTCIARATGDGWVDQGVQVGPGSTTGSGPGVVAGGGTRLPDGTQVTTVSGSVPPGTTKVTFHLTDGTVVTASIVGTTWAAWFPGDASLDLASLTAYDASGTPRLLDT